MTIFADKVAIVTGGGSGIGRALALELVGRGARVILADLNRARVEDAAAQADSKPGTADPVLLDVTDWVAVRKLVDDTYTRYGRLDYIFNNAGIGVGGEARDYTIEDWKNVLDVNLYGVIHGIQAAYPLMVKQGFGHIVNTGSIEGLIPFPATISYAASKHAVVGLSTTLRLEAVDLGVKVSVVCPGLIRTNIFTDSRVINLNRQKMLDNMSKLKGMSPENCAKAILKGVEKNKAVIMVTVGARFLWWLHRLSPAVVRAIMTYFLRRNRRECRIEDPQPIND